ncbi:hypothetical protein [Lewinella sp. W8]|uniref:hypothetical protein n=1 Tax=Lewinella sp. W8 TaxID=2528208 RepID=UPI001067E7CC|nr:hypothetical protein [Lewinella sp. W8]MTB53818.1 hypothetical protein [Lewinella sp. W8]
MKTLLLSLLLSFGIFWSSPEAVPRQTSIQLQQPTAVPGSTPSLQFNWTRPTSPDPEDPSCQTGPLSLNIYLVSAPPGGSFSGLRYYEFQQLANAGQLVKSFTGLTGNSQLLTISDVLPGKMQKFTKPNTYYVAQVRCAGPGRSNFVGFQYYGIQKQKYQIKPGVSPVGSPILRRSGGQ